MLIGFSVFLAALAPLVLADVKFTTPAAGASLSAKTSITVEWTDSGDKPPLSSLTTYNVFLCAGGNDVSSQINRAFGEPGSFSSGNAVSDTVPTTFGDSVDNAYFFKIISVTTGGTVTNYSPRFSLEGMTQPFPANVKAGIQKAGTTSPPTENNVADDAGPGAGANPPAGSFAIPYLSQSGQIFYAPMQGRPGTKITAKTASPRYPTSSVSIAKTYLPTPKQTTTMTLSMTFSTDSHAHTASPAAQPKDDMQKYLARWKD